MADHLFPRFLEDPREYELAERFWRDLWGRIDPRHRERCGWVVPWVGTGARDLKDGNPIFSAYSPVLGRGVRVIQDEPAGPGLDIQVWFDTVDDGPGRIEELVIACTLSAAAADVARPLLAAWARGEPLSLPPDAGPHETS